MDIPAQISEMTPEQLAPVLVSALARMGQHGRQGSEALIAEMRRDEEAFEENLRSDVQEAISWLVDEVSNDQGFSLGG